MALRKFSEDPKWRGFLSTHFDAQLFVNNIIKDDGDAVRSSELCFQEITACVDEVNEEIKGYISVHRDELMSGMQGVALLAERYAGLSEKSQKLQQNIHRLKKEALESYDVVKQRTTELERIHQTNIRLRLLRQFVQAKGQLDHHLKAGAQDTQSKEARISGSISDVRVLAAAAKTLNELEGLLQNDGICNLDYVREHGESIKRFGYQLRTQAQEKLLGAMKERNQATLAACLQIYFNLQSLPEAVLLAVDTTARHCIELSRELIDLDQLVTNFPELRASGADANRVPGSAVKRGGSATSGAGNAKVAIKEMCHSWASVMFEQALQVQALQKVIAKKEDPSTHRAFLDVLRSISSIGSSSSSNSLLASGKLMDLLWERMTSSFQDVIAEKLKAQPSGAVAVYPHLRKASVDMIENLKALSVRDGMHDVSLVESPFASVLSHAGTSAGLNINRSRHLSPEESNASISNGAEGVFGSLQWSHTAMFEGLGMGARSRRLGQTAPDGLNYPQLRPTLTRRSSSSSSKGGLSDASLDIADDLSTDIDAADAKSGLVAGFKPFRDSFLVASLGRMQDLIYKMFPDVDGYIAAVPSKRDLQSLTKVFLQELSSAAIDGDVGLVRSVAREAVKAIRLLLSKVEGIISSHPDTRKIVPGTAANAAFVRNSYQDHNVQLIVLLANLREALDALANQVLKSVQDTSSWNPAAAASSGSDSLHSGMDASMLHSRSATEQSSAAIIQSVVASSMKSCIRQVDELSMRHLLAPLLDALMNYIQSNCLMLLKEGLATSSVLTANMTTGPTSNSSAQATASVTDCSKAVQLLCKQIPDLARVYLLHLPRYSAVSLALEEIYQRIMLCYISTAALVRPVNESSRLRAIADLNALDQALAILGISLSTDHAVLAEQRAFRRLLFIGDETRTDVATSKSSTTVGEFQFAQFRAHFHEYSFLRDMRPSTLLGYLMACAPAQLPLPYQASPDRTVQLYLDQLLNTVESPTDGEIATKGTNFPDSISRIFRGKAHDWKSVSCEAASWQAIQACLDIFVQRISVADPATRPVLRGWYEGLLEIGQKFFSAQQQ